MSANLDIADQTPMVRFAQAVEDLNMGLGPRSATVPSNPTAAKAFASALARAVADGSFIPEQLMATNLGGFSEANGTADVDLSQAGLDFVRSIRVFDVEWSEHDHENNQGDHDCRRGRQRVRIGSYGIQGDFVWRDVHVTEATSKSWLGFTTRSRESCAYEGQFRGIGVEWRDHWKRHGYEVVRY